MSKAVDDILSFLREEHLSDEDQAELIQRLRDGEGDTHKPAGQWVMNVVDGPVVQKRSAEDTTAAIEWIHGPHVDPADGLMLTFYHGQMDGKPVIQIDGSADFRINVNDCPVWDQRAGEDYVLPEDLAKDTEVWVGVISDSDGRWVYVGRTEEALYHDMRINYGPVEFRDESNHEWAKRVRGVASLSIDSHYIATEEGDE